MSRETLIRNERTKLWATFFNNLAVGTMLAGAVVPMFGNEELGARLTYLILGFVIGGAFFTFGQILLRDLRAE